MAAERRGVGRTARAKAPLRAVREGEKQRRKPFTVTSAAKEGTVRDQLVALRDRVAKTVEDPNCPPRDLASLSRRLMEITKEIAAIDAAEAEDAGGGTATPDEAWEAV